MTSTLSSRTAPLAALLLATFAACGDDGGAATPQADASPQADADTPLTPRYAITTQVLAADAANNQSYLIVTDSLDSATPLSLDKGIEIAGRAIGAGPDGGGAVFVATDAAPTVTRYDLQADGSLAKGATVSFQGKGLRTIGEYGGQFQFVSETKAYFFDGQTAQAVVWNPRDMTVTGDIPLRDLVVSDSLLTFTAAPLRRGNELIVFAGWRKGLTVPSQAAVIVIDTTTDTATIVKDDRCGYVRDGVFGADGKVYVATEAFASAVHRLNPANAPAPCLLRFDLATRSFDTGFHVQANSLFAGAPTGMLIRGPGDTAYLRVLDETVFPITDTTNPRVLASADAWKWARVTLGDTPTVTMLATPPTGGSVVPFTLGDRTFIPLFVGRDTTRLYELTAEGLADVTLTTPGLVFSAVKLR